MVAVEDRLSPSQQRRALKLKYTTLLSNRAIAEQVGATEKGVRDYLTLWRRHRAW